MANVKISDLPIGIPNQTSIFPFVDSGTTYQGAISAITSNSTVEVTYSELVDKITGETLNTGSYYIVTDFKTCYDQPDFNSYGNEIIGDNYKEANVEPIIVFAISSNTISTTAYQPAYPKDRIQYDWTFSATERTQGVAYGRISERIDEFNNRTDYDHRTILFKRYQYIEIDFDSPYQGTVSISPISSTEMTVNGTGTNFTGLTTGQYVGFRNGSDFRVYEITSISGDTLMTITGLTNINTGSGVKVFPAYSQTNTSYLQNNITTAYTEYYTFDYNNFNVNNYIGNYANSYFYDENSFILANNVFQGSTYRNNTFGDMCYNNSFDDDCENNTIGNYFYNNITDDVFDGNIIGNRFNNNRITSNFQYNRIGENFQLNNLVQNSFYRNNIMNGFEYNIISGNDFQNNEIGSGFNNNVVRYGQFYKNDIGNGYNYNKVYSDFYGNLIGNGFANNTIYCEFNDNTIGEYYGGNTLGDINNLGSNVFSQNIVSSSFGYNTITLDFYKNKIGTNFYSNDISGQTTNNVIGNRFENNTIYDNFYDNQIFNEFKGNMMLNEFEGNNIDSFVGGNQFSGGTYSNNIGTYTFDNDFLGQVGGNTWMGDFYLNTIGDNFNGNSFYGEIYQNTIGNNFYGNNIQSYFNNNTIGDGFQTNEIKNYFNENTIGDGFGYGAAAPQGNKIGNNFYNNTVGEYFYNNSIPDNFRDNIIDNFFQWNIVNTAVSGVCLSTGMLYDITTVNVFKNKNGDDRLSYYDELDVLTIETLTEAPCLGGLNALDIPENDLNFGLVINPLFTLSSTDFTDSGYGGGVTPNGTLGFTTDGLYDAGTSLYNAYNFVGNKDTEIDTFFNNNGLLTNNTGYIFDVMWGAGSSIPSGKVLMGFNGTNLLIAPINTGNNNWQTPGQSNFDIESIAGTFNFTATFILYSPTTAQGNSWC